MQMYRVQFARKLQGDAVDQGDVIVCAANQDSARDMVATVLQLPGNGVEYKVSRVKPSLHVLRRQQVSKAMVTVDGKAVDAGKATMATFPGVTEGRRDEFWYAVEATASIRAGDENEAIVKLAKSIQREMAGEAPKGTTKELDIKCERREHRPRAPAVEQNGLYAVTRLFQGGDTRT